MTATDGTFQATPPISDPASATRWVFRLGGGAAIAGAILAGAGNLIHPVTPMHDQVGVARVMADSEIWVAVHLAIVVGILLMLGGLVAVYHSIRGGLAGALARFGLFAGVAGATFILFGLAVALSNVYPRWLGWVVLVAGAGSIAAGLIQASIGEPTDASRGITIAGPTVITLWTLVVGILLVRKSTGRGTPARSPSGSS